jgi:peroxiredoxin
MVRLFLISVSCLLMSFQILNAQNCRLNLHIEGLSEKDVLIEHYSSTANKVFSGKADASGSVSASLTVPEYGFYKVTLDKKKGEFFLVMGPGDEITIRSKMSNLIGDMVVEGSEENAAYLRVRGVADSLRVQMAALEQEHKRLTQQADANKGRLEEIVQIYSGLSAMRIGVIRQFMATNPGSLAVLFYTEEVKLDDEPALYDVMIKALKEKHPNNFYVQDLHRKIEVDRVTRIGAVAPDIALPNPDGDTIRLSSLKGKIVLLDFWAAWCGPCRRENPHLVRIYDKYKDHGFEIYGVSLDRDKATWIRGIQEDKLTWTLVSEVSYFNTEPARVYGVTSIPYAILLDREGRIVAKRVRAHQLEAMLDEMLKAEGR